MTATNAPSRPDPTRTGAVWVTGTGAFLLLAAAAVFTAVRWDQIPDAAKLGALALATGACLLAGRGLKAGLPATAGALFHLGAFLVPIDVAAVAMRTDVDWAGLLLAEGIAATITFAWAAATERSAVLRGSFAVAVVALAGGIGATTALPPSLVLAAFAAAALLVRHDAMATGWAAIAGAAPLFTFVDRLDLTGAGTLERLGLVGEQPRATAVLTAIAAAAVLGIVGRRRNDTGLPLIGALVAAVGIAASWTGFDHDPSDTLVGLAVAFLVIEATAYATRQDEFWRVPAGALAWVAELAARFETAFLALFVALFPFIGGTDGRVALATAVLGVGWLVADRRTGAGRVSSTLGIAIATVATVAIATGSPVAVAVALVVVAGAAVVVPRPGGWAITVAAAVGAPLMAMGTSTVTAVLVGIAGSVILTEAAVRRSLATDPAQVAQANEDEGWAWVLAILAMLPGAAAVWAFASSTGETAVALVAGAVLATLVAAQADRARTSSAQLPLGTIARLQAVSVLAGLAGLPPVELGLVALVVAVLSGADALRLRRPEVALGASIALPVAVGGLCHGAGVSMPSTGVALTLAAAVFAGLGSQLGRRWSLPVTVAAGIAIFGGLVLAAADPSAFADALMVTGGIGLAVAVDRGRLDGVFLAGIVVTGGIWLRLADADVTATEPYLLPVAALLFIAGLRARSTGTSSWIAYGPIVAVLGGTALAERISGGGGWHAVAAGTVGVVAVAAGGHRKLAAPLFLGTALLVALAGYETLAITASLPTWTWLALGGSTLLAAGVAMERHDVGPLETGRRLVDVVEENFA